MASADDSVSTGGEFRYQLEELNTRLRNGLSQVFSLGDCQKELSEHLAEISNLNRQVAKWSADVSTLLSDFEKDISCIRVYYQRILSSTEALVDYGSGGIISEIVTCLKQRQFSKAKEEIIGFLECLMKLICHVEKDVQTLGEDCPVKIETVSDQIKEMIQDSDMPLISDAVKKKEAEVQKSQVMMLKAGAQTACFLVAGVASGFILTSKMPEEMPECAKVFASAGRHIFTSYATNTVKTLGEVLDATKVTSEVKKKIESIVSNVYRCLKLFIDQLNKFQKDIETIKVNIDGCKRDAESLDDDTVDGTASKKSVRDYVEAILQKIYKNFQFLRVEVVENNGVNLEKDIGTAMDKLKMNPA